MELRRILFTALVLGAVFVSPVSQATVLYSNPPDLGRGQVGDCLYNTTCGAQLGGNTYAGQKFTFGSAGTFNTVEYNAIVLGATAPTVNWFFTDNNGQGGLPGTILFSGTGTPLTAKAGPSGAFFGTTDYFFPVGSRTLPAGTYYVAIQAVTTDFQDLISQGIATSGAVETDDGGLTWSVGFGSGPTLTSIAVTLENNVPEPSTLALLGSALIGGGAMRRRRKAKK